MPLSLFIDSTRIHCTCGSRDWLFSATQASTQRRLPLQRERSSAYANSTPGIGPASETLTSLPYFSVYSRSQSAIALRRRSLRNLVQAARAARGQQEPGRGRGARPTRTRAG